MVDVITRFAPAKLNLALAVGQPATDGRHPICSWMLTVNLFDELRVTKLLPDRLSRYAILWHANAKRTSDIDWSITTDLAVRAHLALEEHTNRKLPVQLKLDKTIPVGGGLGGGSSDAAAMLHAVNELYELELSLDELAGIGAQLGSDVPFFVHGGSAVVRGMGEQIEQQPHLPELHAVIAFPETPCPTGRVYRQFDDLSPGELREDAVKNLAGHAPQPPRPDALFNDLTRAAVRISPELDDLLARLSTLAERPAHLSGSGSSLFVLCDDSLHAAALADAVQAKLDLPAVAVQPYRESVAVK